MLILYISRRVAAVVYLPFQLTWRQYDARAALPHDK
jgi:hypothetical protein